MFKLSFGTISDAKITLKHHRISIIENKLDNINKLVLSI